MKSVILSIFIAFSCVFTIRGQQLYMPRNIKAAYKKGTRSGDGRPGKDYWQNGGKYSIDITLDTKKKVLTGVEKIIYTNNSSDTLKSLVIRFVNNIHKPEAPRSRVVSPGFLTSGLEITHFSVAGRTYLVNSKGWGTVGVVRLRKPILPHSTIDVNIGWNYPLSAESGREGQIDSTTFYVAYAYPRISVYDDYNGWDLTEHSDNQEFYNDFNDYVYSIRAPKNYVVWGTGDLLNADEVLNPKFAERLKRSYTADDVIHIASAAEMKNSEVTKQNDWNIWKYSVKHISDVCFALSNHYVWDASSVVVDRQTSRRTSTQAVYDEKAKDFANSVYWTNKSLAWFSNSWPGVPYPFSKMIVFHGFADMEYPMFINCSSTQDPSLSQLLQNHETAHTYFPFYVGINETRYAYMDEGWATTLEYFIAIDQLGKESAMNQYKYFRVNRWINDPSAEEDQPLISMSTQVSGVGYANNSYVKASLSYIALKDLLGDDLFKKGLLMYMDNWEGKHPIPWDFFNSMNSGTGQNLNWFFNNWFFSNNYIDLAIEKIAGNKIIVRNIGGFAVPFDINVEYAGGSKKTFHLTPGIWRKNQKIAKIALKGLKKISSVTLDGAIFMDATPADNRWTK